MNKESIDEMISTCPNGHGPMEIITSGEFNFWKCATCAIECMWPDSMSKKELVNKIIKRVNDENVFPVSGYVLELLRVILTEELK